MQPRLTAQRALLFGGCGTVGSEILRGLTRAGVPTAFTWHRSKDRAHALAAELSQQPIQVDLSNASAVAQVVRGLREEGFVPNVFIHAAGVHRSAAVGELSDDEWQNAYAVHCTSVFVALRELAFTDEAHVVLVGALDRTQSAPMPLHFAAAQGALSAMTMALAKELGPKGVRINMVALGLLDAGLSRTVDAKLESDYKSFSALRRLGRPEEAARVVLWLALENTYLNGRVLPVNGGL